MEVTSIKVSNPANRVDAQADTGALDGERGDVQRLTMRNPTVPRSGKKLERGRLYSIAMKDEDDHAILGVHLAYEGEHHDRDGHSFIFVSPLEA